MNPSPPPAGFVRRVLSPLIAAQKREAGRIAGELSAVRGLLPLLMKPRNGEQWTADERNELLSRLRRLSRVSPYLLLLLLPGSALLLPLYAWWLDRRRNGRGPQAPLPDSLRP
jgi:hypothetical protein